MMTTPRPQVDPEFHELLARSEEILASIKSKRRGEHVNWSELHDLNDELSQLLDKMTAMVVPVETDKE